MNRDLLEALGALAAEVYFDALERHPGLLGVADRLDDEARVAWQVLVAIDELLLVIRLAQNFGEADVSVASAHQQEDLPF